MLTSIKDRSTSMNCMAPSSCCCYTTDQNYLMPTLLSASQLRINLTTSSADICVICFGEKNHISDAAEAFCKKRNIIFILAPQDELEGAHMMCARFFMPKILGNKYNDILYIDGDTQITESVLPLIKFAIPSGKVLATADPMVLIIDSGSRESSMQREYFNSIGIDILKQSKYFNSGVMRFLKTDWEVISKECLIRYYNTKGKLKFPDQDLLNLVIGRSYIPISFKWNFPAFLIGYGLEVVVEPRIYHFMSNPRPWNGAFLPWGSKWHLPYRTLAREEPEIAKSLKTASSIYKLRYSVQQRIKFAIGKKEWGTKTIVSKVLMVEAEAAV